MARLLISALKIFLVLVLAAAAGFGALLLADYEGWPRWIVAVAVAGVLFIVILILFIRRYYYRRREEKFVKRVVDQDKQAIEAAPAQERRNLLELQDRWTAAVAALRASRLRLRGDPLYTLPWFMIFGETSSGKSTAVSHARLSSILTDVGPTKGIASTRNCDWWFFEKAVILDTAGRYAVPLEDEDRKEWERFLVLLAKYRRKEPLNGLIITLPADKLFSGNEDSLVEYGRSIRMRIDQLMRVLGAKFPIYVLITKIDLILGMAALAEILPGNQRSQAVGLLNETEKRAPLEFLDDAVGYISRRLKDLRLQLSSGGGKVGGRIVLFPDEFQRLAPGIKAFVNGAFHENPYQETPFLRGLFISSGRQSGLSSSGVLGGLESFKERRWPLPDTGRGLFLHDFFASILPKDRSGFRPIREYASWRAATMNLAVAAWLLLLLFGVGLASLSYVHVRNAMEPVYASFQKAPRLGHGIAQDMVVLGLLRDRLSEMEYRLGSRIWPTIGFLQGRETLGDLKSKYTEWFRSFVLNPTDQAMKGSFSNLEPREREQALSRYLEYLVWRIDTLKAREKGRSRPDTSGLDGPVDALNLAFAGDLPYEASFFPDMYRSYAAWEDDLGILKRERKDLQVWANRVIEMEGSDLHWMVQWAESRDNLPQVTLEDFWPGPGSVKNAPVVSRAFTTKGKAEIVGLLDQVAQAAAEPEDFKKRTEEFWKWYAQKFYSEWGDFANAFDAGLGKLLARNDWLNAGGSMSNLNNPYFKLISRMNQEFDSVRDIMPDAVLGRLSKEFAYLFHFYKAGRSKATLKEKIAREVEKLEAHLAAPEKSAQAVEGFEEYMNQLGAFAPVMATIDGAYRFASQNFGHTSTDGQASPMELALAAMNKIKTLLEEDETAEEPFWRLVEGPLFFMVTMTTYETACAVNELWSSQVMAEISGVPQGRLWDALFGDQGVVKDFLSGTAKPFLKHKSDGWSPRSWLGVPFPFHDEFLSFLDQGSIRRQQVEDKYTVSVSTLPTNVNKEARSEPYQTRLTLQCGSGPQKLDNFNFPASTNFIWEPGTCGEVSLKIFFREVALTRTWEGEWGFRDFLREFRQGRNVYSPEDFPQEEEILEGLGIKNIQVHYIIEKAEPILDLTDYPPLKVPGQAAHCWVGLGEGGSP